MHVKCIQIFFPFKCFFPLEPPKTEAQLKKEAKKREKLEKFQQKKEMEAKKKMQPTAEVWIFVTNKVLCFVFLKVSF